MKSFSVPTIATCIGLLLLVASNPLESRGQSNTSPSAPIPIQDIIQKAGRSSLKGTDQQEPLSGKVSTGEALGISTIQERNERKQQDFKKQQSTQLKPLSDDLPKSTASQPSLQNAPLSLDANDPLQRIGRMLLAAKHSDSHVSANQSRLDDERQARQLLQEMKVIESGSAKVSAGSSGTASISGKKESAPMKQLVALAGEMRKKDAPPSFLDTISGWFKEEAPPSSGSLLEQGFQDSIRQRHHYLAEKMANLGKQKEDEQYQTMNVLNAQLAPKHSTPQKSVSPSPTLSIQTHYRPVVIATGEQR